MFAKFQMCGRVVKVEKSYDGKVKLVLAYNNYQKQSCFFDVVCNDKITSYVNERIGKGDLLIVDGTIIPKTKENPVIFNCFGVDILSKYQVKETI